jgi:small subunit ribosomal protein S2
MPEVNMKNMLEAGVHFGHQTHRWNPKMKQFIFGPRNGIYIIDLEKTVRHATEACAFIRNTVGDGGKILFVATKKQAKLIARDAADRAGMPHVTERWLGGTLTNFQTIRRGCEKLDELDRWRTDGTYERLPKKEVVVLERKRKKLEASLGGVRHMRSLPAALFVIDPETERIAVREANRLGLPVVSLVDTNCDPDPIDFVIPGNDDAIKSVTLFVNLIADACLEGASLFETRTRQPNTQQPQAAAAVEKPEAAAPVAPVKAAVPAPVADRVVRKQLRNIPTEIDYRESPEEEATEEVVAAEAVAEDVVAVEATSQPVEGEAKAKPADKKKKK